MADIIESDAELEHQTEDHWIALSDLMTGLMMIFLLIALAFMIKVEADEKTITADAEKTRQVAEVYDQMKNDLYRDLEKEFSADLDRWGAELDKNLTIRFKEPDILFDSGKAELKPRFVSILDDFFPRYVNILTSEKYKSSIKEVRIEGHTSSIWLGAASQDEAYFHNMELSQARTRSTLQHLLIISAVQDHKEWLRQFLTANGLSSSKTIKNEEGVEDKEKSQRVEFRIVTDADEKLSSVLELPK